MYTYYGHPVTVIRRGRKNSRIRFESGKLKLVPNEAIKGLVPISA